MTRPILFIEDPYDPDAIDPMRRPARVDALQQRRAEEPAFGEGLYELACAECGFWFKSDDPRTALCRACEGEEITRLREGWERHAYPFRRFRRGGGE